MRRDIFASSQLRAASHRAYDTTKLHPGADSFRAGVHDVATVLKRCQMHVSV
jgi:hypothetical protein